MNHHRRQASRSTLLAVSLLVVLATQVLAANPSATPAQVRLGIGVGPSELVLGLSDRTATFTVSNPSAIEVSVTAEAYDFILDSAGNRVKTTEQGAHSAASWMTADPAAFTLAPGQSQVVSVQLSVPDQAPPGDHYAVMQAAGTASDAAWAKIVAEAGQGAILRTQVAFPVTVIVRVPGTIDNSLVADLQLPSLEVSTTGEYTFAPGIRNTGNIAAVWWPAIDGSATPDTVAPTLRLTNTFAPLGGDALLFDQNKTGAPIHVTVLPGQTKTQSLTLKDVPLLGSYDYTYKLPGNAADGRADITATGHFVIVNLQKVVLYVVLPLAALLLLIVLLLLRRRYNRRAADRARVAKQVERAQLRRELEEQIRRERGQ